jgi:Uri superfamily endonuclease
VLAGAVQSFLPGSVLVDPPTISSAPSTGGAYALILELAEPVILCRSNGPHQFAPGRYVYAGSAYGPGGLRARVGRHFRESKAIRWHVDQLTCRAGTLQAVLIEGGSECEIVTTLTATGEFHIPLKGFGSTDCGRCRSHLLQWRAGNRGQTGGDCLA